MHLQHSAPDQLVQQVAPFALQQVVEFARTQTTTTDRQTSLLAGSDRHVLGVLREAYPRVRCHRTLRPRGTLAWRTAGGREGGREGRDQVWPNQVSLAKTKFGQDQVWPRPSAGQSILSVSAFRVSTGLHVEHRRPKAGDAPHEGLLKSKGGGLGVLGFRS